MSTTIDQRVVEMRFDNKQFERGVSDTMSTLEKLKQKLNFNGAVKGVESVNSAAKGVSANMTGLGGAVEQVSLKFSALQIMGVTALTRLTNSAITAGTRIAKALTIDPVMSGMSEYETKMGSIQTILANTQHEGTTLDDVTAALDELNTYADKTIYNFQEMTRNIGTFTAAGVDLNTSVQSIKGIANLAAVSGSTSQQASTAMYQLSQALAAGKVSLMDWNSVVNAGMGGKVFQDALIRTSELLDTGAKKAIEAHGSFRESLTKGEWLTTEVLTETLKQLSGAYSEADLIAQGFTESQAKEIAQLAVTASDAATKVKTFTQLFDTLKESAQSGWAQTWELIFGDFEEAKEFFTGLSDMIGGVINSMSDYRNNMLGGALNSNYDKLINKLRDAGHTTNDFQEAIRNVWKESGKTDEELDKLIESCGSLEKAIKTGKIESDLLNEALAKLGAGSGSVVDKLGEIKEALGFGDQGEDVKTLQTALEELGHSVGEFGIDGKLGPDTTKAIKEFQKAAGLAVDGIAGPETLAALQEAGKSVESLSGGTKKAAESYEELVDNITKKGGRELFLEGFSNVINGLVGLCRALGRAWADIFPAADAEKRLYNVLNGFSKLTEKLRLFEEVTDENGNTIIEFNENGKKIVRTFKGVLAVVDIIATLLSGGFKIALKIVTGILDKFGFNILDVTAIVGDALVKFRDWVDSILNVTGVVDFLVPLIKKAAKFISDLVNAVKNSKWFADFCGYVNDAATGLKNLFSSIPNMDEFQKLVQVLKDAGTAVRDWIKTLKDSENIPGDIIAGLVKGITGGVPDVIAAVFELAKSIISGICKVLGIHSPSTVMIAIGGFIIAGLVKGILDGETSLVGAIESIGGIIWDAMKLAFEFIKEHLSGAFKGLGDFLTNENGNIDWGKIFAGGMLGSLLWVLIQFANAFKGLTDGIGGIGDILDNAGEAMNSFRKVLDSYSWDLKAKALQKLAISIAILAGAIWILSTIEDPWKLVQAVGAIAILAGVMVGLAWAMSKFSEINVDLKEKKIKGLKSGLMQIALALAVMAFVVKMLGDIKNPEQAFGRLIGIAIGLTLFMAALGGISRYSKDLGQFGSLMLKLSIAMALMIGVIKLVRTLDARDIVGGVLFATGFAIFVTAVGRVASTAGEHVSKVGGLMIKLAIAMGMMVFVCKLIGMLNTEDMIKGAAFAAGFAIFVGALLKSVPVLGAEQKLAKLGGLIMSVSFSMALMVGVCKLVGKLRTSEMVKGALFVAGFTVLIKAMVSIPSIGSETEMAKVTGTIIAMSIAVGILAAVSVALGHVKLGNLVKGVAAVSILCGMMALMVRGLRGANEANKSIMMMAISIGVMAAAIVALTFIDDTRKLMTASAALAIVMGMFGLIAKYAGKMTTGWDTIAVMTLAVGALAGILYLLTDKLKDPDGAIKAAVAVGVLMAAMTASLKVLSAANATAMNAMPAMGVLLLIVAGVSVILGIMSAMKVEPSIETAASISILLLAMAGVTAILSAIGPAAGFAMAGAVAFAAVVGVVGALMVALGALNKYVPGLEELLTEGIGVLQKIGEGIGRFVGGFIGGIGEGMMDSLNDMIDTFGVIVEKLVSISDTGTEINTEGFEGVKQLLGVLGDIALMTVGTSLADAVNFFLNLGGDSIDAFQSDGVAFFKAMKAIGEASAGIKIDEDGFDNVIKAAEKFIELQNSIDTSAFDRIISWFSGKTELSMFADGAKSFITSMKEIFETLDEMTITPTSIVNFAMVIAAATKMVELQNSIDTSALDKIISWFSGKTDLSMFADGAKSFITSMKGIFETLDEMAVTADSIVNFAMVIAAAAKMVELQNSIDTSALDKIISWFSGKTDLSMFAEGAKSFITSMKDAFNTLGEDAVIDTASFESIMNAASQLVEFQKTIDTGVLDKIISWFTEKTDLGTFGDNVKLFATGMGTLKTEMGEDGISQTVVDSVVNAGAAIAELQKALPEEHWFDGKMNLSDFAGYVEDFGKAMGKFSETAAGIDQAAVNVTLDTANRIKSIIESLVGLDTSGLTKFTGIGTGNFGADGAAYQIAQTISDYSDEVAGIDTSAVSTSVSAAKKLKDLIASLVGLDISGIENFKIESIGTAMQTYGNKVAGIDTTVVSSSIGSANRLKNLITGLVGLDTSGIASFKPQTIGDALKNYGKSVFGLDTGAINKSVSSGNKLKSFISGLVGLNTTGIGAFKKALSDLSTIEIDKIVKAFSGAGLKLAVAGSLMMDGLVKGVRSKQTHIILGINAVLLSVADVVKKTDSVFKRYGSDLISRLSEGMLRKKDAVRNAVVKCITTATTRIATLYGSFYNAGSYLVTGFASGISDNAWRATAKAKAMADAAAKAARDALKINSPSRVFAEIGSGIPEGFALGIRTMTDLIDRPLANMSSIATRSVSDTVSRLATAIDSDMDVQPTIRPVLDLSNIRSGAGAIGSMLDVGSSVGVLAKVGAISNSMNRRGQNVSNAEVVSAIDRLDRHLDNVGNNYYTVGDVTYDDGSNIATAVKDLTRHIRIDRRT